jgi:hypothetical protein
VKSIFSNGFYTLDRGLRRDGMPALDVAAYDLRSLHRLKSRCEVEDHSGLADLDAILADAGIPPLARHTAIGDAVATALAYLALRYGTGAAKMQR